MNALIPVYHADGSLYAWASDHQSAEVVARVVRQRKGRITPAILFIRPGEPKQLLASSVMGTTYSFKESLEHGQAWELKHLDAAQDWAFTLNAIRCMGGVGTVSCVLFSGDDNNRFPYKDVAQRAPNPSFLLGRFTLQLTTELRSYSGEVSIGLARETGLSRNSFPFLRHPKCAPMKSADQIPYYAPDGSSMGIRTLEAARRLIAGGYVKPAYGRKGHLKSIWLLQQGGGNPVETHARAGTRYSLRVALDSGLQCWKLRRVDGRDDDGLPVATRNLFLQVVADCLVP